MIKARVKAFTRIRDIEFTKSILDAPALEELRENLGGDHYKQHSLFIYLFFY